MNMQSAGQRNKANTAKLGEVTEKVYWGASSGQRELLSHLLSTGVRLNIQNSKASRLAMQKHQSATALWLCERGNCNPLANDSEILRSAAGNGDLEGVLGSLKLGCDARARHSAALRLATFHGFHEIAELLLKHGADPNAKDSEPLINAYNAGDQKMLGLLLKHGASFKAHDCRVIKSIIAHGTLDEVLEYCEMAAFFQQEFDETALLEMAIEARNMPCIKWALTHGADQQVMEGKALAWLVAKGELDLLEQLGEEGKNLNSPDHAVCQVAIRLDSVHALDILLRYTDVTKEDMEGFFDLAMTANAKHCMEVLTLKGASGRVAIQNIKDSLVGLGAWAPLDLFKQSLEETENLDDLVHPLAISLIQNGKLEHLIALITQPMTCRIDLDAWLDVAIDSGHAAIAYWLVKCGADPLSNDGRMMSWAAMLGHDDCVLLLNSLGVDPTQHHNEPLLRACQSGHPTTASLLTQLIAKKSGSFDYADFDNISQATLRQALDHATRTGDLGVIKTLLLSGVPTDATDNMPLVVAARHNQVPAVCHYLDHTDVSAHQADSMLNAAAANGGVETLKILIERDPSIVDRNMGQALIGAAGAGHLDTVDILLAASDDTRFYPQALAAAASTRSKPVMRRMLSIGTSRSGCSKLELSRVNQLVLSDGLATETFWDGDSKSPGSGL